ncbi:MAG: hypothetical protein AAGJ40_02270 [Planctomycetota bacterium]
MARNEQEREDLLAEGIQLVRRGRISAVIQDVEIQWLAGWRQSGAFSVFENSDPVFQFNVSSRLRRVFKDAVRYAAHGGLLHELVRQPDPSGRLRLERRVLTGDESAVMTSRWSQIFHRLNHAVEDECADLETVGIEPSLWRAEVTAALQSIGAIYRVANAPSESANC